MFETLRRYDIDPADCEFTEDRDLDYSQVELVHRPTGSIVSIVRLHDAGLGYRADMWVGDVNYFHCESGAWHDVLDALEMWTEEITCERDPDLWAELQQVPNVLAASQAADATNAPFTSDEQAEIACQLDEVRQLMREKFELTTAQLAAVDQRLDEAKEASQRLGRRDWIMLFYGAVISTGMTDAVPPSVIQTVLSTVVHGIAHIFGFGGPPPVIT
jgi:hypothetical protein